MSTTITKRAGKLRRGDVITDFLRAASFLGNAVVVNSYSCGSFGVCDVAGNVTRIMLGYDTGVLVEAPALTPAQQHAEELLELVRMVHGAADAPKGFDDEARALLAKIDPPAPPTLEEALSMLQTVMEQQNNTPEAVAFLDRARRAGVLKP